MEQYLPLLSLIIGVLSAYITVKIAIAELKKDIVHLREKLQTEIMAKVIKIESDHSTHMNEVRDDVKAIFRTLTKIQVDVAKAQGREDMVEVIKDTLQTLKNNK